MISLTSFAHKQISKLLVLRINVLLICLFLITIQQKALADCLIDRAHELRLPVGSAVGIGKFEGFPSPLSAGQFLLTYDDGPSPHTLSISSVLQETCTPAVFFQIGSRAANNANIARHLLRVGLQIGSHTFSHPDLSLMSIDYAEAEIMRGIENSSALLAQSPHHKPLRLFRFPYFKSSPTLIDFVNKQSLIVISADYSPQDWRGDLPEVSFARFSNWLIKNDRGIIVLHDNQPNTIELTKLIVGEIARRKYSFISISTDDSRE